MNVTGAIEQNVERRQLVERARDRGVIEYVELARRHARHAVEALEKLRVHIGRANVRAFLRHRKRGRLPDALSCCGDQCALAREASAHGLCS